MHKGLNSSHAYKMGIKNTNLTLFFFYKDPYTGLASLVCSPLVEQNGIWVTGLNKFTKRRAAAKKIKFYKHSWHLTNNNNNNMSFQMSVYRMEHYIIVHVVTDEIQPFFHPAKKNQF